MKIKIIFLIICQICFIAFSSWGETKNLVSNPSFELSDNNKILGWKKAYKGGEVSQEQALDGKNSFVVTGSIGGVCTSNYIRVPKTARKLLFKANIYVENFKSGTIKPIHLTFTSHGHNHYPDITLTPQQVKLKEWIEYQYFLDLEKYPDTKSIGLWCIVWPKNKKPFVGKVYWDKISVEEIPKEVK